MTLTKKHFEISELMKGTHHFVDASLGAATDHLFYYRLNWKGSIPESLNPFGDEFCTFDADGVIFVGGLTPGEIPCRGTLRVDYLRTKTIRYDLDFEHDGETFHYTGQKVNVNLLQPLFLIKTHTTCYGTTSRSDGAIVSRSVTHFDFKVLLPFLLSFRLTQ